MRGEINYGLPEHMLWSFGITLVPFYAARKFLDVEPRVYTYLAKATEKREDEREPNHIVQPML